MWSRLKEMLRGKGYFLVQEAPARFRSLSRFDGQSFTPEEIFVELMNFYDTCRAKDAVPLEDDGDMLLFQFGTYDWGDRTRFSVSLVRQFIRVIGEETEIWQLILTYSSPPDDASTALGSAEEWCPHPNELPSFRNLILSSPAMSACSASTGELHWERV